MRGFLLAELVTALFLVSIAMVTLMSWFTFTLHQQTTAINRLQALVYATSLLEQWYAGSDLLAQPSHKKFIAHIEQQQAAQLPDVSICRVCVQWHDNGRAYNLQLATGKLLE